MAENRVGAKVLAKAREKANVFVCGLCRGESEGRSVGAKESLARGRANRIYEAWRGRAKILFAPRGRWANIFAESEQEHKICLLLSRPRFILELFDVE